MVVPPAETRKTPSPPLPPVFLVLLSSECLQVFTHRPPVDSNTYGQAEKSGLAVKIWKPRLDRWWLKSQSQTAQGTVYVD